MITGFPEIQILISQEGETLELTQETFYQIAKYNSQLRVNFLIVTNGIKHYCCKRDYLNEKYDFVEEIPSFVS